MERRIRRKTVVDDGWSVDDRGGRRWRGLPLVEEQPGPTDDRNARDDECDDEVDGD